MHRSKTGRNSHINLFVTKKFMKYIIIIYLPLIIQEKLYFILNNNNIKIMKNSTIKTYLIIHMQIQTYTYKHTQKAKKKQQISKNL